MVLPPSFVLTLNCYYWMLLCYFWREQDTTRSPRRGGMRRLWWWGCWWWRPPPPTHCPGSSPSCSSSTTESTELQQFYILSMKRCYLKRVKLKLKKNRKIWMYIMLSLWLEYVARVVGCEQVYHERLETVPSLTPRYHHRRPHHLLSLAGGQAGRQGDFVVHSRPDTRPLLVKNSAFLICRASWRPLYSAGIYYIVGYRNICYWTH